MSTKQKLLILTGAFIALQIVTYFAMVIYNTSFALDDWSEFTRGIFSGLLALSFIGLLYMVLFSDFINTE